MGGINKVTLYATRLIEAGEDPERIRRTGGMGQPCHVTGETLPVPEAEIVSFGQNLG